MIKLATATVVSLFCATHVSAKTPFIWMAPGLYQIDSVGELTHFQGNAKTRQTENGRTGDISMSRQMGADGYTRSYSGNGPVTVCVNPIVPGKIPALPVPSAAMTTDCTVQSTTPTADGFVHTSVCKSARTTITARRLDNETWEMEHTFQVAQTAGSMDMGKVRLALESAAQNGTAEQRERAATALANLPAIQQRAEEKRAAAIASLIRSRDRAKSPAELARIDKSIQVLQARTDGDRMQGSKRERWTRVAHTCGNQPG